MSAEPALDATLLSRVEDASLNASAPTQQRWIDGWLVRFSPAKARRPRCIQPVADGRLPLDDRLAAAAAVYREAGLPMLVRLTPFARPAGLDGELAARGWRRLEDTRVLVRTVPPPVAPQAPGGVEVITLGAAPFAEAVGQLRGSPLPQREAHAQRLLTSPVPVHGWALRAGDEIVCCALLATEGRFAGLYDVHTRDDARGRGLASWLCQHLLSLTAKQGADIAYLQVDAANVPALRVYTRLGFVDAYGYHYRQAPDG